MLNCNSNTNRNSTTNTNINCLYLFQNISCLYKRKYLFPLWNKYPNYSTDIWDSLAIFLEGYAFERQGTRPDFFHAGVDALISCKHQTNGLFNGNIVNMIWREFSTLLNNQRLNEKNNPLYPSNLNQSNSSKRSLIEVILDKIGPRNTSIIAFITTEIVSNNDILPTFNLIKEIRGINNKISSFFLRDLVEIMQIPLNGIRNRQLLQPIDIWVRRTVKILSNNPNLNDQQIATWIVDNSLSNNLNPEQVNMGIWFFSSQIAKSEYRLRQLLNNCNRANNEVNHYVRILCNVCNHCRNTPV